MLSQGIGRRHGPVPLPELKLEDDFSVQMVADTSCSMERAHESISFTRWTGLRLHGFFANGALLLTIYKSRANLL